MTEKLQVVEIREKNWLEGSYAKRTGRGSVLLRKDKRRMCCLGFLCQQLAGAKPSDMNEIPTPLALTEQDDKFTDILEGLGLVEEYDNTSLAEALMDINDNVYGYDSPKSRVQSLNRVCIDYDAKFRFKLIS